MDDKLATPADPRPEPPPYPDDDACCGNGCDPCIWDLHAAEMDHYRQALRAWQARQDGAGGEGGAGGAQAAPSGTNT